MELKNLTCTALASISLAFAATQESTDPILELLKNHGVNPTSNLIEDLQCIETPSKREIILKCALTFLPAEKGGNLGLLINILNRPYNINTFANALDTLTQGIANADIALLAKDLLGTEDLSFIKLKSINSILKKCHELESYYIHEITRTLVYLNEDQLSILDKKIFVNLSGENIRSFVSSITPGTIDENLSRDLNFYNIKKISDLGMSFISFLNITKSFSHEMIINILDNFNFLLDENILEKKDFNLFCNRFKKYSKDEMDVIMSIIKEKNIKGKEYMSELIKLTPMR